MANRIVIVPDHHPRATVAHFRVYEPYIKTILQRWPNGTTFNVTNCSTETFKGQIRTLISAFLHSSCTWESTIDRDKLAGIRGDLIFRSELIPNQTSGGRVLALNKFFTDNPKIAEMETKGETMEFYRDAEQPFDLYIKIINAALQLRSAGYLGVEPMYIHDLTMDQIGPMLIPFPNLDASESGENTLMIL